MAPTVHLLLTDEIRLRDVSHFGELRARIEEPYLEKDRNERSSRRQLALIREACASMSLVVEEDTRRFERDTKRYLTGASVVDIINTFSASTASATAMVVLLRAIGASLQQWLKNKATRSVRLRIGDKSVEIKGTRDVSAAVKALRSLEKVPSKRKAKARRKRKQQR